MISRVSSERVCATLVAEFFRTEAALPGLALPRASAMALAMVRPWALVSIRWRATRVRRSESAIRPASSTPI